LKDFRIVIYFFDDRNLEWGTILNSQVPLLQMEEVSKRFGGVNALRNASFRLEVGEIHALMGANGAGKSTLIKLLCGVHQCDSGIITLYGEVAEPANPFESQRLGIGYVPQEIAVQPYMSVAENIFLGNQPTKRNHLIDFQSMNSGAEKLLTELGIAIDPNTLGNQLSIAEKQLITIAKAIALNSKILILDEATSALTSQETKRLFQIIRTLSNKGIGIIFVTHRLEEIFEICDTATIFRDGETVATRPITELDIRELIYLMMGQNVQSQGAIQRLENPSRLMRVSNLSVENILFDITFDLHKGEILGLAGLVGSGRTELVRSIFGDLKIDSGIIEIEDQQVEIKQVSGAIKLGIGLVPEDRKSQGLILQFSVKKNIGLAILSKLRSRGFINASKEREVAEEYTSRLAIKTKNVEQSTDTLSGGNQQRVLLAKWFATNPKILLVDEPTRGVDVAAKAEIHRILIELARSGVGVVVISSEMDELIQVCNRILVIRNGRINKSFFNDEANTLNLMEAAAVDMDNSTIGNIK
jgi:ABC-type sugar transport system ATPase subunit